MLKVLKFGGSSLADADQFRKVAEIINAEPERRYVVASAPGKRYSEDEKVTDLLLHCHALAVDRNPIDATFTRISDRLHGITPGDFATVMRQQRFRPLAGFEDFFAALGDAADSRFKTE